MIKYRKTKHKKFIDFLNKELPTKTKIKLIEDTQHDCMKICCPDGSTEVVWASFHLIENRIMWPSGAEQEISYQALAHEYVHAWQFENGLDYNSDPEAAEKEAAYKASELYYKFIEEAI